MARQIDFKRINKEDFSKEEQHLIEKLAYPINNLAEQLRSAFNKSIDFNNLNQEVINVMVTVDSDGIPTTPTEIKSNLLSKARGAICINSQNLSTPGAYPTSCPFLSFTQNGNILTVNNITGLEDGETYLLTFVTIGN